MATSSTPPTISPVSFVQPGTTPWSTILKANEVLESAHYPNCADLSKSSVVFVAVSGAAVVGVYALKRQTSVDVPVGITHFVVHESHRGKGVGEAMMNNIKGTSGQRDIILFADGVIARVFYESQGFLPHPNRSGYVIFQHNK